MPAEVFIPVKQSIECSRNTTVLGDQRPFNLPYHRHDAYEIYLFLRGNVSKYIEQFCYQLLPGDLFMITPDQLHRSVCQNNHSYDRISIYIKEGVLQQLSTSQTDLLQCFHIDSPRQIKHLRLSEDSINHYLSLANLLSPTIDQDDFGQDVLANSYLTQLLLFLYMQFNNQTRLENRSIMPKLIYNLMEYVSEHLTEPITLADLSKAFYLNGTYISRQFKKHTGLTIYSYILDQRIALAKKLLKDGCNVSEACYQSGFTDYANFIRSFTTFTGISPGKYAKQLI